MSKGGYDSGARKGFKDGAMRCNPPVPDPSRPPIGKTVPHVDTGAVRSEVGEARPATIGPRTA